MSYTLINTSWYVGLDDLELPCKVKGTWHGNTVAVLGSELHRLGAKHTAFCAKQEYHFTVHEHIVKTSMFSAVKNLRVAIQNAEQFGLVRTESGQVVTGAIASEYGIILTE